MVIPSQNSAPNPLRLLTRMATLRGRQMSRYLLRGRIRFCTLRQLLEWSHEWARQLPKDIDVIIGLPRSGLMVANTLAAELGKPLSTTEFFLEGKAWVGGRLRTVDHCARVLIVDDSINTGAQIDESAAKLRERFPGITFRTAALLPHQNSYEKCDYHYRIIRSPRVFEWDLMHTKKYAPIGFDFDGVLCEECAAETDSEEETYVNFLSDAKPLYIPQYTIDYVISNRLERYRPQCEEWLRRHKVKYHHLVLWDLPEKELRGHTFVQNKVRQVLRCNPRFFVESSFTQARHIAFKTGIPVLCTDRMVLFG